MRLTAPIYKLVSRGKCRIKKDYVKRIKSECLIFFIDYFRMINLRKTE